MENKKWYALSYVVKQTGLTKEEILNKYENQKRGRGYKINLDLEMLKKEIAFEERKQVETIYNKEVEEKELAQLKHKNIKLRAEIKVLEAKNTKLKIENTEYKAREERKTTLAAKKRKVEKKKRVQKEKQILPQNVLNNLLYRKTNRFSNENHSCNYGFIGIKIKEAREITEKQKQYRLYVLPNFKKIAACLFILLFLAIL